MIEVLESGPEISKVFDARIKTPARILFIGQSGTGKTHLLISLILSDERVLDQEVQEVILFSMHYDPIYVNLEKKFGSRFKYERSLPSDSFAKYLTNGEGHKVVIIDDFQEKATRSEAVANLFSIFSRHRNTSSFLTLQNPFSQGQHKGTLFRNATGLALFKPSLDQIAINILAGRLFPKNSKTFHDIYQASLRKSEPYGYLFIDANPNIESAKFRTNLLAPVQTVFIPR